MEKVKKARLKEIINRFNEKTILVIGDVMLDKYVFGNVKRISPEAPILIVEVNKENFIPGGAGNAANNLASLGANVYLAGVLGEDNYSNILIDILKKKNIIIDFLIKDINKITTLKERIVAQSQQLLRVDYEDGLKINNYVEDKSIDNIRKIINEIDGVIISDYGKGFITKKLITEIINLCKQNNKIIVVDPKPENKDLYYGVNLITPNYFEASMMAEVFDRDEEKLNLVGNKLKTIAENVLITRGAKGMTLFEKNGSMKHFPTKAKEVFDVTGAGDTVIVAITLALVSGANMEEAIHIANYAAGVVIGKFGTSTATIMEIEKAIENDKED